MEQEKLGGSASHRVYIDAQHKPNDQFVSGFAKNGKRIRLYIYKLHLEF